MIRFRRSNLLVPALVLVALAAVVTRAGLAQTRPGQEKTLDIYMVDVEGGGATLFVLPSGESVLIDTGNPGGRDSERIMAAMDAARVRQLDYVLLTHYHVDHVGGLQALAQHVPIKHYVDHGSTVEEREQVSGFQALYAALVAGATRTTVVPGDTLPVKEVEWRIVSSAGRTMTTPLAGAGQPNADCMGPHAERRPETPTDENGQSVGSVITFGRFRAVDLGDLLWDRELDLMCPVNRIGPVDLYIVSHHGTDPSGSDPLVHGLNPRAAIMQNSPRKGGTAQTYNALLSTPRKPDIWQAHRSFNSPEQNPAESFIANLDEPTPPHNGPSYWIKVSARSDGSFTVTNARNGFTKTY